MNYVFIGNILADTTEEEVCLFILNIGLTEVTSVERVGRYAFNHTSFHVNIPVTRTWIWCTIMNVVME